MWGHKKNKYPAFTLVTGNPRGLKNLHPG